MSLAVAAKVLPTKPQPAARALLTHLAWALPLAVALGLRLWQSDLTPFLDDEAVLLAAAARMLDSHRPALEAGLALSIHINEPPLVLYFDAIPMLISRSPAWVSACLTAVDALAAVVLYRAACRLAGRFAGFSAALLFAVAPAAIYYSRRIYYSELVPFCVAVCLLALIEVWQRRSGAALAVGFVAAVCATELHASAAVLLPVWLVVAALTWRSISSRRPMGIGLAVAALTLAPYVVLQLHNGWADVAGVARFLREPRALDASALDAALTVVGGGIYRQLLLPYPEPAPLFWLDPIGWVMLGIVIAGAGVAAVKRQPAHLTLLALLVLPVLASLRHTTVVLPYYLLPSLPAAAVLAGIGLSAVPWRVVGALLLAIPVAGQVSAYASLQRTAAADGPSLNYGMPLRYELAAAELVRRLVPSGARLSVSQVGNQATTFPYLTGYRYQLVESDSRYGVALASGESPSYYLAQSGGPVYPFLAQRFASLGVISTSSGQPAFGLFEATPGAAGAVGRDLTSFDADVAHAVRVRGYAAPELAAGQRSPFLLAWQVVDPRAQLPPEVQQFAHLVDASGATWSTDPDERAYPRAHWSSGDLVLTWFDLRPKPATPTGGYWIETGFYGYITNQPLPVLESSGRSSAGLRIGPLRVAGVQPPAGAPSLAVFGDGRIALLAAERRGGDVELRWQALERPGANYTAFVHVLDASGRVVAQNDSPPQEGAFPTSLWRPGDVVTDVHHLAGDPSSGSRLEIGLYETPSLRRLPASTGGDAVLLPA